MTARVSNFSLPVLRARPDCDLCELGELARQTNTLEYPSHCGIAPHHLSNSLPFSPSTPILLVLGQNPGALENSTGIPFVGPSGEILREVYLAGINAYSLASIVLSNTVLCHTPLNAKPSWTKHSKPCSTHLITDICTLASFTPDLPLRLLICSAPSVESVYALVLRETRLSQTLSFKRNPYSTTYDCHLCHKPHKLIIVSTFHPAYILRNPNALHAVHGHLQLLLNTFTGHTLTVSRPDLIPPCSPAEYPSHVGNPNHQRKSLNVHTHPHPRTSNRR